MKRNLKQLLSVVLMLAVAAVSFTVPAVAADTITVNWFDLPTGIFGTASAYLQQGTLFYEKSPGDANLGSGVDSPQSSYLTDYAPLEVWKTAARQSVKLDATEWVRYSVNVSNAGYYAVAIRYGCGAGTGADMIIRTGSHYVASHLAKSGANQYVFTTASNLGYLYLTSGINYIYVDNKSADATVNFVSLTLTEDTTVGATDVTILKPVTAANEIGSYTVSYDEGYNHVDLAAGDSLSFPLTITADGKYKISVTGKAAADSTPTVAVDSDTKTAAISSSTGYEDTVLGVFPLLAGDYTLSVTDLADYSFAWIKVECVGAYATQITSESIADGATVSRGTDSYVIQFNDNIDDVNASQVTLASASVSIPVDASVAGDTLTVSFLETLDYTTSYTLTLTGLKGVNDNGAMADKTVTFTTDDTTNTAGTATVEVTEVTSVYEDVTVTGTVKGSTGLGIKGRTVTVYDPNTASVATGLSGDDGVFTLSFTIPTGTPASTYNYTVESEYGANATAVVPYVSLAKETEILDSFATATVPLEIKSIFDNYANILKVPTYAADMAGLTNTTLFYNHFIGKSFSGIDELKTCYDKMLLLEQMNQATTGSYIQSNIFNDPAAVATLGLDTDKLAIVGSGAYGSLAAAFVAAAPSPAASEDEFYDKFNTVIEAHIQNAKGITATTLDITGYQASAYVAGEISAPLKFTSAQKHLDKLDIIVTASNAAIFENHNLTAEGALGVTSSVSGNTITYTIDYEYSDTAEITNIGKVYFSTTAVGTYTLAISAKAYYHVEKTANTIVGGNPVVTVYNADMEKAIAGGSFTASVTATPQAEERVSSGGGGYVAPPKEKTDDLDQKPVYHFDDMKEAEWAQDMVHALVEKGVISKNEDRIFRPMDNVTREEYVKMIITVIGFHDTGATSNLSDVAADHWATSYIAAAQELGLVNGNDKGEFGIGENITRQDMAVIIFRTFQALGIDLAAGDAEFSDSQDISNYAQDAVKALEEIGIINGMGDNTFAPKANATRAQAAKVIYVMMEVLGV